MRFHERQIVLILDGRYGDVATIRQRRAEGAPEEFVHLVKPANVGHKTEPVGVTEVMIHAAVIRSEERRVGKECRSGWAGKHSEKRKRERGPGRVRSAATHR